MPADSVIIAKITPGRLLRGVLAALLIAAIAVTLFACNAIADAASCEQYPHPHQPEDATLRAWPDIAVPGQEVWVYGSGFHPGAKVAVLLVGEGVPIEVAGLDSVDGMPPFTVNPDGTFYCEVQVPFDDDVTATPGTKTWLAREMTEGGRWARTSHFMIERAAISQYPPQGGLPGETITINGRGWGVNMSGGVPSRVTLSVIPNTDTMFIWTADTLDEVARYGPYEVDEWGNFTADITVPQGDDVPAFVVRATDNNGPAEDGGTGGFSANQEAWTMLLQPTGSVTVTPDRHAGVREYVTVTGKGFPSERIVTLFFGGPYTQVLPEPATDKTGSFTVSLRVPSCGQYWRPLRDAWGTLCSPVYLVVARVGHITGAAEFSLPFPAITVSPSTARPGDTVTITGTSFYADATVEEICFGKTVAALPVPRPATDGRGDFSAEVVVPSLNPGDFTVTVRTSALTATATIGILGAVPGVASEFAFRELIARGLLTMAAAAPPGSEEFGAYVPGLPGDTLSEVAPHDVLFLTLSADALVSVSGQPAVRVEAGSPTVFVIGPNVTVDVVDPDGSST